jgi:calnexin
VETASKDPLSGDSGLVVKSKAKHAAISAKLKKPFTFNAKDNKPFIVQYELNFQDGQDCGGGYIKLLSHEKNLDLRQFTDKTPYTIMFGPDKCGSDSKLHFIFRHVNPKNGSIEEKHVKKLDTKERSVFEEVFKNKRPHLYRLVINPDNTYEMSVDYRVVNHGSLLEHFTPEVNPLAEIDDPKDSKPENWDEREKIPDPDAKKPDDWDESQPRQILDLHSTMPVGWLEDEESMVSDADAEKPDDWDNEIDGEWEAPLVDNPVCQAAPGCGAWKQPMIDNPRFKGKWHPALINNPAYKGKWKARKISNPDYFHDPEPFARMTAVGAVGIELWSMSSNIYFDNFLITDQIDLATAWAQETFDLKVQKLDASDAGMFR